MCGTLEGSASLDASPPCGEPRPTTMGSPKSKHGTNGGAIPIKLSETLVNFYVQRLLRLHSTAGSGVVDKKIVLGAKRAGYASMFCSRMARLHPLRQHSFAAKSWSLNGAIIGH